jgi:hypothetical protein
MELVSESGRLGISSVDPGKCEAGACRETKATSFFTHSISLTNQIHATFRARVNGGVCRYVNEENCLCRKRREMRNGPRPNVKTSASICLQSPLTAAGAEL